MEFTLEDYHFLIGRISEKYDIEFISENEVIHEFYEGDIPLFKALYVHKSVEVSTPRLMLSFHLEMSIPEAIEWYSRVYNESGAMRILLTESYFKDDNNETFLGVDAEQIKMYKVQQQILAEYAGDKESAERTAKAKVIGRHRPVGRDRGYFDKREALQEFSIMMPDKDKDKIQ